MPIDPKFHCVDKRQNLTQAKLSFTPLAIQIRMTKKIRRKKIKSSFCQKILKPRSKISETKLAASSEILQRALAMPKFSI